MANSAGKLQASVWLQVFYNSKVNGAPYGGDALPVHPWAWPTGTFLQRRLRAVRADWDGAPGGDRDDAPANAATGLMH